jgi:hypothetical protein
LRAAIRELARFDQDPNVPDWFADPAVQRRMSELIARSAQASQPRLTQETRGV